jgi:hypothetical protein
MITQKLSLKDINLMITNECVVYLDITLKDRKILYSKESIRLFATPIMKQEVPILAQECVSAAEKELPDTYLANIAFCTHKSRKCVELALRIADEYTKTK